MSILENEMVLDTLSLSRVKELACNGIPANVDGKTRKSLVWYIVSSFAFFRHAIQFLFRNYIFTRSFAREKSLTT